MGIVRAQKSEPPEPFIEAVERTVLVIGGGATGLTSALESAKAGYKVILAEKEAELGGWAKQDVSHPARPASLRGRQGSGYR